MPGVFEISFGLWSWPLTVIWIVVITNALNLIDGMDGLATGIAAITCAPIALFALASGQILAACVMLSLLGALLGFLIYNFNPARIFLGDSGSLLVGFLLGSVSVSCSVKAPMAVGLAAPLLALGLPLFDTLGSVVRRFLERRSLFCADAGHLHHRLLRLGLTQRRAVLLMYAATLLAATAGLVMIISKERGSVLLFAGGVVVLMVLFRISGAMRIRENLALIKRNLDQKREHRRTKRISDASQVQIKHVSNMCELWTVLEDLAKEFNLKTLQMQLPSLAEGAESYKWQVQSKELHAQAQGQSLTVRIPFRLGTRGSGGELYAEVPIHGNTELAADKIKHLGRLMDCACQNQVWTTLENDFVEYHHPEKSRTPEMSLTE